MGWPPTYHLALGWNWWAPLAETNVEALNTALGSSPISLLAQDGSSPTGNLIAGQMYKIQTATECSFTLDGTAIANVCITISPGLNWIGFTGTDTKTLTEVLSNFTPTNGDIIISQDEGFAICNDNTWNGTLEQLHPGKGYVYISQATESKTLMIE